MPGSASDYLENKVADHILGGPDFTRPATVYVGLWTSTLTDSSTGSSAGEVSGGGYSRVAVTNNTTNWPAATGGVKKNGTDITFPQATGNWGTVTDFAILDAATGGNILFYGTLDVAKTIGTGDTFKFPANNITITVT